MFAHFVYGLRVHSALALPELAPAPPGPATRRERGARPAAPDVVVRLGSVARLPTDVREAGVVRASAEEACLVWPGIGAFQIRGGAEVTIGPNPGADESVLRLLLLGPVLGVLLHQRDRLVLHASAVAMTGAAVGFLGRSGWGKSTTAAALHARGFGLVTDDVLALDPGGPDGPVAYPGVPQLKLWPDAATAVGEVPDALPRLRPGDDKRARRAMARFRQEPLPLRRLYVLADAARTGIDALTPRDAVIELVRHSYTAGLLQALGPAGHFRQCARLAAQVPVRRLRRPRSLAALAHLAAMVEEDIA